MKKLVTLSLAVVLWGCGQSDSQKSDLSEKYYGVWQLANGECPSCTQWVFSPTEEGGILAEVLTRQSVNYDHYRKEYSTTYQPETGNLVIHGEFDVTAGITNGRLNLTGKTFEKIK